MKTASREAMAELAVSREAAVGGQDERPAAALKISETEFLSQVLQVAEMLGWHAAHFRPALTGRGWRTPVQGDLGKGWPDLVLGRGDRLIFAELKRDGAKTTSDQERVLDVLILVGEARVWRPADFDRIGEILR
jgi:hypothetical protein